MTGDGVAEVELGADPETGLLPFDQIYRPGLLAETDGGTGTWIDSGVDPCFVLEFDDSTYWGNPYWIGGGGFSPGICGGNLEGQEFTVPSDTTVDQLSSWVKLNPYWAQAPADSLHFAVQDVGVGPMVASGEAAAPSSVTIAPQWIHTSAFAPFTLLAGHQYRLIYSSPRSVTWAAYTIGTCEAFESDPFVINLTYEGTQCFQYSNNNGVTWMSDTLSDAPFEFSMVATPTLPVTPRPGPGVIGPRLYPEPSRSGERLYVGIQVGQVATKVSLFNLSGELVFTVTEGLGRGWISPPLLAPGIYLAMIETASGGRTLQKIAITQ